jgi:hypothetical protein
MGGGNLRNQIDKALERMDRCLVEALAAQTEIRGILQKKESGSADTGNAPAPKPETLLLDRYHEIALTNDTLRRNPIDQPKKGDFADEGMVFFVRGCLGPKTPIIHPDHMRLLPWVLLGAFFICYDVLMMPYRICFSAPAKGPMFYFEAFIQIYFIMDLALNFFIGFMTPTGELVVKHSVVIMHYAKGWFFIDFLASFPVDFVSYLLAGEGTETGGLLKVARGFRLLKLVRIFRIAKLKKLLDKFEQELEGSAGKMLMFAIGKILLLLFSIGHLAGCFWYYTAVSWQDHYGVSWITEKMSALQSIFRVSEIS